MFSQSLTARFSMSTIRISTMMRIQKSAARNGMNETKWKIYIIMPVSVCRSVTPRRHIQIKFLIGHWFCESVLRMYGRDESREASATHFMFDHEISHLAHRYTTYGDHNYNYIVRGRCKGSLSSSLLFSRPYRTHAHSQNRQRESV